MILLTIVAFLVILGLLVFVHELGHFVMAKRAGMEVEEFGFGFPPRIFGIRRGETVYSLNWIPFGGFVKITGEDGQSDHPRSFVNKGFWARFSVLIAGVTMNFVLAWFLFFIAFAFVGTPMQIDSDSDLEGAKNVSERRLTIIAVHEDSPAAQAGFRPGDAILSVDGRVFEEIGEMIDYTKSRAGAEVVYAIGRGEDVFERTVVPRLEYPEDSGPVGFAPAKIAVVTYGFGKAIWLSLAAFADRTLAIFVAFGILIKGLFVGAQVASGVAGPIGIAVLTRDFLQLGLPYLVQFTAVLSINLAIINAVPFPALDGGRVLFLVIEKIRGARSVKWEPIANTIGFLSLLLLMVVVIFFDFSRYSDQFRRLLERVI